MMSAATVMDKSYEPHRLLQPVFGEDLSSRLSTCKVLVVGAGGIGCELLKNLALTGIKHITVIDLDTIDVSNLNRQFLFRREHVGQSKAQIAAAAVKVFNPLLEITPRHADIKSEEFNTDFFKQFDIVLNALDNLGARNHVNRMCLAADVPLVESGSAGYLGQTTVIKKGKTECFECLPKAPTKRYPVCTIRNTPSLPIHCIVWAKFLFNQLLGHPDDENSISPNLDDPEHKQEENKEEEKKELEESTTKEASSLRKWAESVEYDPEKVFKRLFVTDVNTLLSMNNLWKERAPPRVVDATNIPEYCEPPPTNTANLLPDQITWSLADCVAKFMESLGELHKLWKEVESHELEWDKDDKPAMDFVAAASNIRAYIFGIKMSSRFDIKSMAGNIIPAIATTNAVIAGLIVVEALHIISDHFEKCKTTYFATKANQRNKLLIVTNLEPPVKDCYVCAERPEVRLVTDTNKLTIGTLKTSVMQAKLGMIAPDVMFGAKIILSSEEEDADLNLDKTLHELGIRHTSVLEAEDFHQNFELKVIVTHSDDVTEDEPFKIIGTAAPLAEEPKTEKAKIDSSEKPGMDLGETVLIEDDVTIIEEPNQPQETNDSINLKRTSSDQDNSNKRSKYDNDIEIID